eukprot:CAMPEP_0178382008 /NCGR_PEP_ID=MMETSP0689_2-20121128/6276_1 /TAXON_ID=160604 /ORGANISM="Amphidinium massartii, Strain CS-259" /LENGTH=44 /DNA_ID= /DNA_START= /DNA_END= /DNA_ORIENTATION=
MALLWACSAAEPVGGIGYMSTPPFTGMLTPAGGGGGGGAPPPSS